MFVYVVNVVALMCVWVCIVCKNWDVMGTVADCLRGEEKLRIFSPCLYSHSMVKFGRLNLTIKFFPLYDFTLLSILGSPIVKRAFVVIKLPEPIEKKTPPISGN